MKNITIILSAILAVLSFQSCTTTYYVSSKQAYDKTKQQIITNLNNKGYELIAYSSHDNNQLSVEGVSYSKQAGYGTALKNNVTTSDSYTLRNKDTWNDITFQFDYSPMFERDINTDEYRYCVYNVSLSACSTQSHDEFDAICSAEIPSTLTAMPADVVVNVFDKQRTNQALIITCIITAFIGGISLLAFAGMAE